LRSHELLYSRMLLTSFPYRMKPSVKEFVPVMTTTRCQLIRGTKVIKLNRCKLKILRSRNHSSLMKFSWLYGIQSRLFLQIQSFTPRMILACQYFHENCCVSNSAYQGLIINTILFEILFLLIVFKSLNLMLQSVVGSLTCV